MFVFMMCCRIGNTNCQNNKIQSDEALTRNPEVVNSVRQCGVCVRVSYSHSKIETLRFSGIFHFWPIFGPRTEENS